ncbi:MAG: hypothetical protein U0165_18945 [Polyangiaceae bacterium]
MLLVVVSWVFASLREKRIERDPRRALSVLLPRARREVGAKAERALLLVEQTKHDPSAGSAELAELHWARALREITRDCSRGNVGACTLDERGRDDRGA